MGRLMEMFQMLKSLSNLQVWHRHHPLHQAVPVNVEPFATPEGFHQSFIKMSFCSGSCHFWFGGSDLKLRKAAL